MANKVTCIGKIKCPDFPVSEKEIKYLFEEIFNFDVIKLWSNEEEKDNDYADVFEFEIENDWCYPFEESNMICSLLAHPEMPFKHAYIEFVYFEHENDMYGTYKGMWLNNVFQNTDGVKEKFEQYLQITRNI